MQDDYFFGSLLKRVAFFETAGGSDVGSSLKSNRQIKFKCVTISDTHGSEALTPLFFLYAKHFLFNFSSYFWQERKGKQIISRRGKNACIKFKPFSKCKFLDSAVYLSYRMMVVKWTFVVETAYLTSKELRSKFILLIVIFLEKNLREWLTEIPLAEIRVK